MPSCDARHPPPVPSYYYNLLDCFRNFPRLLSSRPFRRPPHDFHVSVDLILLGFSLTPQARLHIAPPTHAILLLNLLIWLVSMGTLNVGAELNPFDTGPVTAKKTETSMASNMYIPQRDFNTCPGFICE